MASVTFRDLDTIGVSKALCELTVGDAHTGEDFLKVKALEDWGILVSFIGGDQELYLAPPRSGRSYSYSSVVQLCCDTYWLVDHSIGLRRPECKSCGQIFDRSPGVDDSPSYDEERAKVLHIASRALDPLTAEIWASSLTSDLKSIALYTEDARRVGTLLTGLRRWARDLELPVNDLAVL